MADGQEEDFSQLPLTDRFAHKNWKVRKEGYEAAAKEFELTPDESDPAFRPFILDAGLWKAAASDSNVAAQQEGLAALCAFLKFGGPQAASRSRSSVVQPICEKGLSSTRPAAKANALEALLLYVENDKPDLVLEDLLPSLANKQPKVIAATLAALTAIYHNFGVKVVDPKPVLKELPKAFGHADKNVRAEATNLSAELYRWLKEAMKTIFWSELKPVQQTDLEKLFEKVKDEPSPKQERFTRAQQAAMATASPAAVGGDGDAPDEVDAEEDAPEVDAFDLAEPVDVLAKIPAEFLENVGSTKWKDRKDALDNLYNIFNTPRIKAGSYDEIVQALAKCMKDANIAVVTVAANCIEKLAHGLRKGFARYRSTVFAPMMERFKEKKTSVADALGAGLDAVFASTSLSDCLEETLGFLANKNPQVKGETIKFLVRCLRTTRDVPSKAEQKSIADAATKLLTESTEAMRSGGAEILGTMMKIIGERAMGPYLDGLDDIRKNKIKEFFDTAEVKAKDKPKPVAPPAKIAGTSAVGKKVLGGAKKPAPKKAPVQAAPPLEEIASPAPKPTSKALPRVGALTKPGSVVPSSAGPKLAALKKPAGTSTTSPSRRVISPPMSVGSEEEVVAPSPSKYGMGRGGLAGRSLARPTAAPLSPPTRPLSDSMSVIERAELEELRAEKTHLLSLSESLRSSNGKLTAEISELQNQNAQLIEDHTRDVLQIKAKETQLVRARGECDVLRVEVESARREVERYKREIARLGRESIGRERESMIAPRDDHATDSGIYSDANHGYMNGNGSSRPVSNTSTLNRTGSGASGAGVRRPNSIPRPGSNYGGMGSSNLSPSEEKENSGDPLGAGAGRKKMMGPATTASNYSSGRASPQRPQSGMSYDMELRHEEQQQQQQLQQEQPAPAENWKRAAEVTSALKARIEAMRARQGLNRPN